jgi:dsDNA-specific endonuclease/ATPase MutS2
VVLHVTPGSSTAYVEPQAAIPLNNSLAAARGEAYAATEAVLWKLSGLVMEVVDSLNHILEVVRSIPLPLPLPLTALTQ